MKDKSGPAFPEWETWRGFAKERGLTKRQWFAGMALAAMTAAPDYSKGPCNSAMAERAYAIADEMLKVGEATE